MKHVNEKNAGKHVFWRLMLFNTRLAALAATFRASCGFLLLPLIMMQSHRQSDFCANLMYHETDPTRRVAPPWNVYMAKFDPGWEGNPVWQTGLPALAGHPTYYVNVIKLNWEIIWIGLLLPLSGLPHVPGVPHLHVNRPLHSYDQNILSFKNSLF